MSESSIIAEIRQKAREERAAARLNRKQAVSKAAAAAGVSVYRLRGDYNRKKPSVRKPRDPKSYHRGTPAEDWSPQWVRDLRFALTEKFIRTGVLDTGILSKLKAYANAVHKTSGTFGTFDETTGRRQGANTTRGSASHSARTGARPEELGGANGRG